MKCLNNLYYLTDLYFFDFKQAIEEFNKHYHCFTTDKSDKSINKQKLLDYFINGIASGTKKEVKKLMEINMDFSSKISLNFM